MNFSEISTVYFKEMLETVRDWRTLVITIMLPLLTYPSGLIIASKVFAVRQHKQQTAPTRVFLTGGGAAVLRPFFEQATLLTLTPDVGTAAESLKDGRAEVAVVAPDSLNQDYRNEKQEMPDVKVQIDGGKDNSFQVEHVLDVLHTARLDLLQNRLDKVGVAGPWIKTLNFTHENIAATVKRSGAWISSTLPTTIVLLILMATLYPALDLVTGERERGTLMLLLVAPVKRQSLILGKLLTVFSVGLITCITMVLSLAIVLNAGLTRMQDATGSLPFFLPPENVLLTMPLALPLIVLFGAIAVCISAYSRNIQQGQGYSIPYILLVMGLSAISCVPVKHLPDAIFLVPIANVSVCMSDVLRGEIRWLPLLTTSIVSCLYAWYVTRVAIQLLGQEEILFTIQVSPKRRRDYGRAVAVLYAVTFVCMFYAGQMVQVLDKVGGMIVTQFAVILLPSVALVAWLKLPVREVLSLKKPDWRAIVGAPFLAPGSVLLTALLAKLQNFILPMPEFYAKMLTEFITPKDVPIALIVFAMAVMPGICEEMMFRGAIYGLLRIKSGRSIATCVLVGVLFGFFHLSGYRLLPTGVLGVFLTLMVLRTGSIFPSMLFHACHNSLAIILTIYAMNVETPPMIAAGIASALFGLFLTLKSVPAAGPSRFQPNDA